MPPGPITTVERKDGAAVVHVHGDLVIATARRAYDELRAVARRGDVERVILDFTRAGRLDSAGIAVVSLIGGDLTRAGRALELAALDDRQRAAIASMPRPHAAAATPEPPPGTLERIGGRVLHTGEGARALGTLIAETVRQALAVATRRARLPAGALGHQIATMGLDALLIVGLLSFLIGTTIAFQGAVQLQRFGAGVFVADLTSMSMVREIGPLMTAVIITGRTGAAIAAELGTMRVRSEIDALATMGINPARFLILPRMLAITFVGPALSLIAMFIGMCGGMLVAQLALDISADDVLEPHARAADARRLRPRPGQEPAVRLDHRPRPAATSACARAATRAASARRPRARSWPASSSIIIVDAIFATVSTAMRHG